MTTQSQTEILCHPDKIEIFILNTAANRMILPQVFSRLIETWTAQFRLRRRNERKEHRWQINLWNDGLRLTFYGSTKDLIAGPSWHENPYSNAQAPYQRLGSHRSTIANFRITDKTKEHPQRYCDDLSRILSDLKEWGVHEKPRVIEIALDCYGDELSWFVYHTVRLTRDNPLNFFHYVNGIYRRGGSPDGTDTEYSMRRVFQWKESDEQWHKSSRRELACYSKPEYPFYRVELRLRYRFLDRFFKSLEYHRATESGEVSASERYYPATATRRTLDLLGLIPYFVQKQLIFETIDVARLYREKPSTRFMKLHGKSLREQRFRIASRGLKISGTAVPPPPIRYIIPTQIE